MWTNLHRRVSKFKERGELSSWIERQGTAKRSGFGQVEMGCWKTGKIVIWFSEAARRAFGTGKMARMEQGLQANLSEKQDSAPLFHVTVPL